MLNLQPTVSVELLTSDAKLPVKPKSQDDAGFDVYVLNHGTIIPPRGSKLLDTGLRVSIPVGYCIQVNPRSGKASKNGLLVGARVIDSPYRGELKINIFNHSDEPYEVSRHDPIAQLLILPCAGVMVQVDSIDTATDRGQAGFGSTDGFLTKLSKENLPVAKAAAVSQDDELTDHMHYEAQLNGILTKLMSTQWDSNVQAIINAAAACSMRGAEVVDFYGTLCAALVKLKTLGVSPEVFKSHLINYVISELVDTRVVEAWTNDDLVPEDLKQNILIPILNVFK